MTEPREPSKMTQEHPLTEHGTTHGKLSSWVVVGIAIVAFGVGGGALIQAIWWLVYVCAGVFALSTVAGLLVGIMDDTVQWASPPSTVDQPHERPQ